MGDLPGSPGAASAFWSRLASPRGGGISLNPSSFPPFFSLTIPRPARRTRPSTPATRHSPLPAPADPRLPPPHSRAQSRLAPDAALPPAEPDPRHPPRPPLFFSFTIPHPARRTRPSTPGPGLPTPRTRPHSRGRVGRTEQHNTTQNETNKRTPSPPPKKKRERDGPGRRRRRTREDPLPISRLQK